MADVAGGGDVTIRSSRKRWTHAEDDKLRESAPNLTFARLSNLLPGRSREAVKRRLTKLGLHAATGRMLGTYTIREVAAILGVPLGTVREWVDTGKLRHIRAPSLKVKHGRGGRVLIIDADLDAFITEYPFIFHPTSFPEGPHKGTLIMARPQDWVSNQQAARMLGVARAEMTVYVRSGRIKSQRFGHCVFFRRQEVARFRDERRTLWMKYPGFQRRWARHQKGAA